MSYPRLKSDQCLYTCTSMWITKAQLPCWPSRGQQRWILRLIHTKWLCYIDGQNGYATHYRGGSRIPRRRGRQPSMRKRQHTNFPKNCMKLRKCWSGGAPEASPLDPPLHSEVTVSVKKSKGPPGNVTVMVWMNFKNLLHASGDRPRTDATRSPKLGYQWSHKKDFVTWLRQSHGLS